MATAEALFEDVVHMARVFVIVQSPHLSSWEPPHVRSAFRWAAFFEQVHRQADFNPHVRRIVEDALGTVHSEIRRVFPRDYRQLTFEDLEHCQGVLLTQLLCNPSLPNAVSSELFSLINPWDDPGKQNVDYLADVMRQRAAASVLSEAAHPHINGLSLGTSDIETAAKMLMRWLRDSLGYQGTVDRVLDLMDSLLLPSLAADTNQSSYFCPLMASSLLIAEEEFGSAPFKLLLEWLMRNNYLMRRLCEKLHLTPAGGLAQRYPSFRAAYIGFLTEQGRFMHYDVVLREWVHTSDGLDWNNLLARFRILLEGPEEVKKETESALLSLKVADGDFNVWGLSVWTDLLITLKKM
ncbi:Fanconi anemia group F protein [Erpetoichthys calabaricus]|uniref:Fanconi anemia group F protein n=1 Tax=Erpetoichthys calabaricus TaxID=27687 RepID=UPI00109F5FF7|nr:Fanconi anemia group F protein [Erpetoichthys calabaricus]XP_051779098.1 Fanconi anemia group F protein [Erpetoichthys calabaricus]